VCLSIAHNVANLLCRFTRAVSGNDVCCVALHLTAKYHIYQDYRLGVGGSFQACRWFFTFCLRYYLFYSHLFQFLPLDEALLFSPQSTILLDLLYLFFTTYTWTLTHHKPLQSWSMVTRFCLVILHFATHHCMVEGFKFTDTDVSALVQLLTCNLPLVQLLTCNLPLVQSLTLNLPLVQLLTCGSATLHVI